MNKLLPCPFCGEYPKIAEDGGSTGPWFCVWHDCPPVEGGKARHYGESLGCISISTTWFHTEAEAIAAWNTRAERTCHAELNEQRNAVMCSECGSPELLMGWGECKNWEGSTCIASFTTYNHCPNCGAKVIGGSE